MESGDRRGILRGIQRVFSVGTLAGMSEGELLGRFVLEGDEAAFEAIVLRHGPMVWGVCRRLLRDPNDVEDAFQATFLVLLRRAGSIRDAGGLGCWLYGVAYRVASRARADAARRRAKEQGVARPESDGAEGAGEGSELRGVIDLELDRLPEKYRGPVVLCYLEGKTQEEAARTLRWTTGMVRGRLAAARERLRRRLALRGLAPSSALLTSVLTAEAGAILPAGLVDATVVVARRVALGQAVGAGGTVSASITILAEGVLGTMFDTSLKFKAAALVIGAALLGTLPMALGVDSGGPPPAGAQEDRPTPAPEPAKGPRTVEFQVVEQASRRPLEGVSIRCQVDGKLQPGVVVDDQGRFRLPVPDAGAHAFDVWAKEDGFVPISYSWSKREGGDDMPTAVTLAMEAGTTIGGLIRDAEGRPVRDATVYLLVPRDPASGRQRPDIGDYPVKTDAEGRWRCDVMPSKLDDVWIRLSHPDYAVDTTYGATPKPSMAQLRDQTGVMVMKKGLVLEGRVLDREGRPIEGASVAQGSDRWGTEYPDTMTDAQGRFRFRGIKPGEVVLTVQARGHAPDVKQMTLAKEGESVEFRLGPGRTIRGRVVDPDGKGVAGITVVADTWRGHRSIHFEIKTDQDGRFRWDDAPGDEVLFDVVPTGDYMRIRDLRLSASEQESTITLARPLLVRGTVTDAETGKPIEAFTLLGGFDTGPASRPYFVRNREVRVKAGRYEFRFVEPRPHHYLRFEADGYRTVVSRAFRDDEGESVFDVKLHRDAGIAGVVHSPEGGPLANAEVVLVGGGRGTLMIADGHLQERAGQPHVTTKADGRFTFNAEDEATSIVVVHDEGWAFAEVKTLADKPVLRLEPWGRIAGVFRLGKRPGGDDPIMSVSRSEGRAGEAPGIEFRSNATADLAGRFALEKIPAGEVDVCRSFRQNQFSYVTHTVPVPVLPGKTSRVTMGGLGRTVVGRVSPPADRAVGVVFSSSFNLLTRKASQATPPRGLDDLEQARWNQTEEGKAYRRGSFSEIFKLNADGSFRIDDVTPGHYEITISLTAPPPARLKDGGSGDRFETLTHTFDVPDSSETPADRSLDLGTLHLAPPKPIKGGPPGAQPSP